MTKEELKHIINKLEADNALLRENCLAFERMQLTQPDAVQPSPASPNNYQVVFDHSLYGIFITIPDGTILHANKAACELFEYSDEELRTIGRRGIFDENYPSIKEKLIERKEKGSAKGEIIGIKKSGERFFCEWSSNIYKDESGNDRTCTIVVDISQRKAHEAEKSRLLAETRETRRTLTNVLDSISDGYVVVDNDWRYTYLNEKGAALLNPHTSETLLGSKVWDLFPEAVGHPLYTSLQKVMKERKPLTVREYFDPWDVYLEVRIYPAAPEGITIFFSDITQQYRAEVLLSKSRQEMQLILDHTEERFLIIDKDLRIITQNKSSRERSALLFGKVMPDGGRLTDLLDKNQLENFTKISRKVLAGEKIRHKPHFVNPDGSTTFLDLTVTPFFNANNEVDQFMISSRDITTEENFRLALLESEEKYRKLFYSNPVPLWIYDLQTKYFLEVNDASLKKYGYSREEFLAMRVTDIRPAEDVSRFAALGKEISSGRLRHSGEWRHLKKDGEIIFVDITSYRIDYEGRNAALILAIDITQRKVAEETLKSSEQRFRSLIEKGSEVIALHDREGRIIYVSPSMGTTLGYLPEDRVGKSAFAHVHPDDIPGLSEKLGRLIDRPGSSDRATWRHLHADGSWHWMEGVATNLLNDPAVKAVVHNFRDVTLQKAAEQTILLEKELSESIINSLPGIFYLYDQDVKFSRWNHNFETVSGYTAAEIRHMRPLDFYDVSEKALLTERIATVFEKGNAEVEAHFLTKTGEKIPYFFNGWAIDLEGRRCLIGVGIDITNRKKAEIAIRDSEEKRRLIMNAALDAIICIDINGNITFWNPQAESVFGWKEAEVMGRKLSSLIIPEPYGKMHDEGIKNYLKTGKGAALNVMLELRAVNRAGKQFPIELTVLPIKQAGEEFFCAFIRDISKRKMAEDAIRLSKERYDIVTRATNDSIWDWDLVTNIVVRDNKKLETLFGYEGWEGTDVDYYWNKLAHPADWERVTRKREEIIADPALNYWEDEYRFMKKDGEYAFVYDRGYILRDDEGKALRIIGASHDISERKLAEGKIRSERNLLRTLIDNMPDAIYVKDSEGRKILSNKVDLEIMDAATEADVIGKTDLELYPNAFGIAAYEADMNVIRTGKPFVKKEEQFHSVSGSEVWLLTTKVPLRNADGEITGLVGIGTDIANLKKIEAELLQSEEKYRLLFYLSPMPKLIFDIETRRILDANYAAVKQYGFDQAEFTRLRFDEVHPGVDIQGMTSSGDNKSMQDNGVIQLGIWDHHNKNGELLNVEMMAHATSYNGRKCMMVVCQDITEKINFQQALLDSNERFTYATKATSDAIWDWDLVTDNVYWGEGFEHLFGHPIAELSPSGKSWSDLIHPDDQVQVLSGMSNIIQDDNGNNWSAEFRFRKADGTYAFVHDKGIVVRDENGKGIRMIGAMQDITARREGEEHLKLLESVITNATDSILITDAEPIDGDGPRIIYVNDSFTKMTGYSREEVIGKTPRILQGPKTNADEIARLRKSLESWTACKIEVINYKKNGEEFWINMSIVPVADEKGWFTHWIAVERDVTEIKLAENELKGKNRELKKLSAYLQNVREEERKYIAREVHDELGQLASALKIDIDWLDIRLEALDENAKRRIAHANKTIEILITSIRKIASSLRPSILDDFGLNAALKWHCAEFQHLNGIPCMFEPGFDDKVLLIHQKTEMYRIVQESLTNVMRHAKATNVVIRTAEDDRNLYLVITDNGRGFDLDQRKNTLGLIGLRERALSLGGEMNIESIVGHGTTIKAIIPKTKKA